MLTLRDAADSDSRAHGTNREVNTWRDDEGRVFARALSSSSLRSIEWTGVGTFTFDRESPIVSVERLPGVTWAQALELFSRTLQPLILQSRGFESLHASGVLVSGAVVALAGFRFSGKSTLAHAMAHLGFAHFADDVVVLGFEPDGSRATVHAMPFTPRLRPRSRDYFEQSVVNRQDAGPVPQTAPLGAIAILKQDPTLDQEWTLTRIPANDAFRALLQHAHVFDLADEDERRRVVSHYLAVVATTPIYDLVYRPDFSHLPELAAAISDIVSPVAPAPELERV